MDILEFAEQVTKRVREKLGDRYRVEVHEVRKNNNVKLTGMVILPESLNISPTIYLDSFHEAYENGTISRVLTTNLVCFICMRAAFRKKKLICPFFRILSR